MRRSGWLAGLIFGCLAFGPVAAMATDDQRIAALRDLTLANPGQGLHVLPVLRALGAGEPAQALQQSLLTAHFEALADGTPPTSRPLGAWLDAPPATAEALHAAWQRVFDERVRMRVLPVSPKAQPASSWVTVELSHTAAHEMPLLPLALQLGEGKGSIRLACRTEKSQPDAGMPNAPVTAPPSGPRERLVVTCHHGSASKEARALFAAHFGPDAAQQPQLRPLHLQYGFTRDALIAIVAKASPLSRREAAALERAAGGEVVDAAFPRERAAALGDASLRRWLTVVGLAGLLSLGVRTVFARLDGDAFGPVFIRWSWRMVLALGLVATLASQPGQQALAWAADALGAGLRAFAARLPQPDTRDTWSAHHPGLSLLGLLVALLFLIGRTFTRLGVPAGAVHLLLIVLTGMVAIGAVILIGPVAAAGTWGVLVLPLVVATVVFLGGSLSQPLLAVNHLLDADGLSWPGAIVRAWRRCFDFTSPASGGEFWSYFVFFALAWALTRWFARPWDIVVAVLLTLPLLSLSLRRWRAMSGAARLVVALSLLALVLQLARG